MIEFGKPDGSVMSSISKFGDVPTSPGGQIDASSDSGIRDTAVFYSAWGPMSFYLQYST
jgi:hypothetical protein